MTSPDIPPQAITASVGNAALAIRQVLLNNGCSIPLDVAQEAAEAAAPHLADAERKQAEYWRGRAENAWKQLDEEAIQRIAGWPKAVAAERERCAQLAEGHANYPSWADSENGNTALRKFADLLREQP